jgi:ABC-type amino acid transport substrate-binding protein
MFVLVNKDIDVGMIIKIFISVIFLLALFWVAPIRADEIVFDKVLETRTIRCGYPIWPPSVAKDPNSKQISGYSYDFVMALGEKLNLKIDWAEETGWGIAEQGIKSGRYDMVCADVCTDAPRARNTWFSTPFTAMPNFIFVRADDNRFDDWSKINDPAVKIAVVSNTNIDYRAREFFPKATRFDVTDLGGDVDIVMAVATGKADVSFNLLSSIDKFNKNQERQLKILGDKPSHYCYGALLLPQGDTRFKYMIDTAIHEMNSTGQLEKIIGAHFSDDKRYWRVPAYPYQPTP